MATRYRASIRYKPDSLSSESRQYRRKEGSIHTNKIHRRTILRFKHILTSFVLLAGIFFGLQQIFLLGFTWDKLNIKEVLVSCENQQIKKAVQDSIASTHLGNILLLDIQDLQEKLKTNPRIKSVHIRKVFPLSLNITIEERQSFAVLQRESLFQVDNEGIVLGQAGQESSALPLLFDRDNFKEDEREKIRLAGECLASLGPEDRKTVEILDLSEYQNIKIKMRDSNTWLILGGDHFGEKFRRFQAEKTNLSRYGILEYVDLRFRDRYFIKPLKESPEKDLLYLKKEVD